MAETQITNATSLLNSILPVVCAAGLLWVGNTIQEYGVQMATMNSDLNHMNRSIDVLADERQRLSSVIQEAELRRKDSQARIDANERKIARIEQQMKELRLFIQKTHTKM